jgi:uncharacterized FlaG/YvyC family protein
MYKESLKKMAELQARVRQFAEATEMLQHFIEVMDFEGESLPEMKLELKKYLESDMVPVLQEFKEEVLKTFPPKTAIRLTREIDESFEKLVNWLA